MFDEPLDPSAAPACGPRGRAAAAHGADPPVPARVLIVDDHRAFVDLLALALDSQPDFEVCGTANSAPGAVEATMRLQPDIVVMDIRLGVRASDDGLVASRRLRAIKSDIVIVIVTAHGDATWIARAARAGANAFAPKSGSLDELLAVLRQADNAQTVTAPGLNDVMPSEDGHVPRLTRRESTVLQLMSSGLTPAQIGQVLDISVHTCRSYVKSIHSKLSVSSQAAAVVRARALGLLDPIE